MRSRDYGTPWPPWLEQNRTWLQGLELRQISMNPTDLHFFTLEDGFFHPYVWWSPEMDASPSAPRRRRGIPPSWLPSPEAPTPTANPPWPHQRRHQRRLCRRTHPRHRRPALGRCRGRPEVAFRGGRRGCAAAAHAGRRGACGGARRGAFRRPTLATAKAAAAGRQRAAAAPPRGRPRRRAAGKAAAVALRRTSDTETVRASRTSVETVRAMVLGKDKVVPFAQRPFTFTLINY